MSRRTMGLTTLRVLHAVASGVRYGFDVMDHTDLPSGTVYPALSRLERLGLLRSRWEDPVVAQREKRPPRKYYRITREGKRRLLEEAARLRALERSLPVDLAGLEAAAG